MREIKLRRRTVQSYGNISRFSEVRWGILPIVSSELFGPAIYVFSIEQILGDLPIWRLVYSNGLLMPDR